MKKAVLFLLLFIAAIPIGIAAPHTHDQAGLPAFCSTANKLETPSCGKTPTARFDKNGVLWIVYVDGEYIKLIASDDLTRSYSNAISINAVAETVYADGENRPKIAFGNENEIYISWVKKTAGRYTGDIRFSRSLDGGKTFSDPITVNDDRLLTSHRFDTLAVAADGTIHLTWLDKRDLLEAKKNNQNYVGAALYHAKSTDRGSSFEKNKKIADHSCECCRISIVFNQHGEAIALWRHVFTDMIRDHAIVNLDANDTAATIQRVTFDNWQIEACPHHGPDMAIGNDDELHLAWFTGRTDHGGLFYGKYDQISKKLTQQVSIDSSATASRPQIFFNPGQLVFVWKVLVDGKTKLQIKISTDNGLSWSKTETIASTAEHSDYPHILEYNQAIYISWWTEKEGFQLFSVEDVKKPKTAALKPFDRTSLSHIEQQYKDRDFLLVLWSLDCPPCFKELAFLGTYMKKANHLKLVLVSTDDAALLDEIMATLAHYELDQQESWYFSDTPIRLRAMIDQTWYGELPRSYFYNKQGQRFAKSGLLDEAVLENWLKL